ncbi:O-antigen ligase family protein [Geodermatophilus tzadiensis]|uniref:O-antigen ligase family protein n=1 Tax=Geodermatophilus tzadiensis TaxID=1137988 RepID=UPI001475140A|nr:O-antigen ligase family protein [Geodermatophilus tzadiensis]
MIATTLAMGLVLQPLLGAAAVGLLVVAGWLQVCHRRPAVALTFITATIVFSSHVFAMAHVAGVPSSLIRPMIGAKDLLAWTLLAVLALRAMQERRQSWAVPLLVGAFLTLGGVVYVLFDSPAPLAVQLAAMRGASLPVLSLGCVALLSRDERRRVAVASVYVVLIGAVYALVELALPRSFVSETVGVGRYWVEVKDQPLFVDPLTDLPGNFFTSAGFPRLTGTFGDPLSAGEMLGGALVLAVAYRSALRHPLLVTLPITAALLLSFTRNGWLLAAAGVTALAAVQYGVGRALLRMAAIVVAIVIASAAIRPLGDYLGGILSGDDASTLGHHSALEYSLQLFQNFPFFGHGWGTGGSAALNTYAEAVTAENAYVAVLTQTGWLIGMMVSFLVLWLCHLAVRNQPLAAIGATVLLVQAVTAFISENVLTFNAGFFPFLTAGLVAAGDPVRGLAERTFPRAGVGRDSPEGRAVPRTGPADQCTPASPAST